MSRPIVLVPENSDFPLQNLPYGVALHPQSKQPKIVTALGDAVVDLSEIAKLGLLKNDVPMSAVEALQESTLNKFMSLGRQVWRAVRAELEVILSEGPRALSESHRHTVLWMHRSSVELVLPANIGDYTDFYSSREHATNVGIMFRGVENALNPNWLHLPVGYHGRSSSIVVSGTEIHRPMGQTIPTDTSTTPEFTPCKLLDFELETALFVGPGNKMGRPISMKHADDHIFGVVLMNDWSARDIQKWEYVPLGPFTAKNFATTISPWIVTLEALEPFRVASPDQSTPAPLPYLQDPVGLGAYDVNLEVSLSNDRLEKPFSLTKSNLKNLYWTMRQQLVHHTVTGCNMRPGDLLGSGTISGSTPDSYGSMLEICWKGTKPLTLPNGEVRRFLQDGDTLTFHGYCQGNGYRVGFGECSGKILPVVNRED